MYGRYQQVRATSQNQATPKLNRPSFIADAMLGTISKKLRIFGFDCLYYNTIPDDDLILIAKKQNRIIITKDNRLATNAIQHDIITIKLDTHTEKEQLVEIAHKIGWKKFELSYSRCSLCNGVLDQIEKDTILDKIPPRIAQSVQEFRQCKGCHHIYWVGTHIRNLEKVVAEINAII
jgi:uncharacterized protein